VVNPQGATPSGLFPPSPNGVPQAIPAVPNAPPAQQPSAPFTGARTPGMIVQPPPQPGQTVNPGQQPRGPNDN
jgi:hypothetical protein